MIQKPSGRGTRTVSDNASFLSFALFFKNALQYVCVSAKMNNRARVREYRSAQRVCRAQPLLKERMKICWITNV